MTVRLSQNSNRILPQIRNPRVSLKSANLCFLCRTANSPTNSSPCLITVAFSLPTSSPLMMVRFSSLLSIFSTISPNLHDLKSKLLQKSFFIQWKHEFIKAGFECLIVVDESQEMMMMMMMMMMWFVSSRR